MPTADITLGQGLQQRTAEFLVPPGALLSAQNCRQNRNGALSKRPGNVKLTNQYQQLYNFGPSSLNVAKGGALATYGDQLLINCNAGTACYSEAHGTFGTFNPGSEALLTRTALPLPSSISANLGTTLFSQDPTFITDGTHNFFLWIDSLRNLYVTIQNVASGAIIQDRLGIAAGANNVVWAVPLMVGAQFTVVYLQASGSMTMVGMASPYTGAFTVSVVLRTGLGAGANIDAAVVNSNLFVVVFPAATINQLTLQSFTAAGASVGAIVSPIGITTLQELRLDYSAAQNQLWVAWRGSAASMLLQMFSGSSLSTSTITSPMSGPFTVETSVTSMHIVTWSANRCVAVTTKSDSSTGAALIDSTLSSGAGGIVIARASDASLACLLASKPFLQDNRAYAWMQLATYSNSSSPQANEYGVAVPIQYINVLCDLRMDTGTTGTIRAMRPVATDSPRFAYPRANGLMSDAGVNIGLHVSSLPVVQVSTNVWSTLFGVRQTAYETAWQRVDAGFAASQRWASKPLNTLLLTSSGLVENWDGVTAFENGFLNYAALPTTALVTGGALAVSSNYYYRVVPMAVDNAGNVHRGIPSALTPVAVDASHGSVQLTWPGYAVSDRLTQNGSTIANGYATYWEIYRSAPNPGSTGTDVATNFVDVVINSTATVTYTDGVAPGTVARNALCYTFGGALPNGCPPGAWDIVAHQGRAFLIADDRSNIYFSKQIVDTEAVNFADGFTIPADVSNLRALASLDDKLIVFSDFNIYSLSGLGPNDDGSGNQYDILEPVQTDVGCTDRRSIVKTPDGIFFQSGLGIYFIDRGLQITYIGQPVDGELQLYPIVTAASLHPSEPWVYFTVTNTAGTVGERLVYDYRVQQWYVDTLPAPCISMARTLSTLYWLDNTGQVWTEDNTGAVFLDQGAWVTMAFETAWIPTDSTKLGFANLDKFQLLAKKLAPCDVVLSMRDNYEPVGNSSVIYFDNIQQQQPRLPTVEIEFAATAGKQESFTIAYKDYAPTGGAATTGQGWEIAGISYQFSPIDDPGDGKLNRLLPAQRGQHLA